MGRAIMKFRPRVPSSRLAVESLEQRRVLSATFAPGFPMLGQLPPGFPAPGGASLHDLMSASPGDGAVVSAGDAPSEIVIHLDGGLVQSWSATAAALYKLGDDGTAAAIFGEGNWPDFLKDSTADTVTIPLNGPLGLGRYRLALVGGVGSFSQMIGNGAWDYMEDQTIAEFEVVGAANPFDAAIDAGAAGPTERTFAGSLASGADEAFYKVELTADQSLWRLGLQLDAQRLGSGLLATLTVYDAQGHALASSAGRRGLASAPDDPYLFAGLQPGTYYVGISPAAGDHAAGDYQLTIAADPVTGPTRVVDFALDWTNGAPTGFTITFSDTIAPDRFTAATNPLLVVDAGGTIHPARLSAAADGLRRLSFVFDEPIPAGDYALVAPEGGGLVDLIGRAPVADGSTAGLLASWTVAPHQATGGPATDADWLDGAHRESLIDNAVGPGGALSLRFGVGTGAGSTTPDDPGAHPAAIGSASATAVAPSVGFVGVLDASLFGRPAARNDGMTPSAGAVSPQGRALAAAAARERLAAAQPAPSPADDGLARSPDGEVLTAGLWPSPTNPGEPKLAEFPANRAESHDAGLRADLDALERIEANRIVDASAGLVQWLFGAPTRGGGETVPDADAGLTADARLLAQIDANADANAGETPPAEGVDGRASRAGVGIPIGLVVTAALAYRLHRHPPQWWRRRRPTVEQPKNEPNRPFAAPRGPRFMSPRPAGRVGEVAGRRRP